MSLLDYGIQLPSHLSILTARCTVPVDDGMVCGGAQVSNTRDNTISCGDCHTRKDQEKINKFQVMREMKIKMHQDYQRELEDEARQKKGKR